jgi:CRP-like cAMP-binding protein
MTHWMCVNCGYYLQTELPPDRCPGCNQACVFNNVTCYRPDCGGERNIDPLLVGSILGSLTKANVSKTQAPQISIQETAAPMTEILSGLDERQKAKVKSIGHLKSYDQGLVICRKGEKSQKLYLVEEGQVAVQSELGTGAMVPLTIVSEGQAFGWSVLVPPYILTASVVASTKVRVLAIDREPLLSLMHSEPTLGCTIMQNIASIIALRLHNVEQEMIGLIKQNLNK